MSLYNVLAVSAAVHCDLALLIFGIGLSIPIVICGAGFLATLMNRFQWIVWLGGGILGWVAGEMVVEDRNLHAWLEPWVGFLPWTLPALLAVVLISLGWWLARRAEQGEPMNV